MNRTDIANKLAENLGLTKKQAVDAVAMTTEIIIEALKAGETVQLPGFGSFSVTERAARVSRNPRTGEKLQVPASRAAKFKPGTAVKTALNS